MGIGRLTSAGRITRAAESHGLPWEGRCATTSDLPFDFIDFWSGNDIRINLDNSMTKRRGSIFVPFDVMSGKMLNRSTIASVEFAAPIYKSDRFGLYDWKVEFRVGFFF